MVFAFSHVYYSVYIIIIIIRTITYACKCSLLYFVTWYAMHNFYQNSTLNKQNFIEHELFHIVLDYM